MPNETKSYKQRFNELLDELAFYTVSKEEVKAVLDTFVSMFKDFTAAVSKDLKATKEELKLFVTEETGRFGREVARLEKRIRDVVKKSNDELQTKVENNLNDLRVDLAYTQSLIKEYDDNEIREKIEEVRGTIPEMPEAFDATEIHSEIEELEKKIEELSDKIKNQPVGSGGGVTNARIAQAFKYILKTEAPVGAINGVNTSYTVTQPIFAVLAFSLNGEVIAEIPNYTVSGKTITFSTPLPAAYSGKDFEIKYV